MGLRTWALRRAMGRLRITDDWIWPYWLEQQLDPRSPSFVPRGHLPVLTNVTHRNWTMVGNLGSPREALVDPRGLVTPWYDGWSLDWWIGADDRWHFPSREASVRQRLVEDAPVVETAMRVPGGDAVHRAYAVTARDELVVVEIENRSTLPFVVAVAVRPYNPEGLAVVERISRHDRTVVVDGRPALLLPRPPARAAASTFVEGDCALTVADGTAPEAGPEDVRCDAGLAQAAFLYPLPHTAVLRFAMPLVAERRTRRRRLTRRRTDGLLGAQGELASGASAARGWGAQARRGMRLELPDGRLARAVEANRRFLLLFHDGAGVTPGPFTYHRFWFRDAAYLLAALDRYGFHDESAEVLRSYPGRQHLDGFFSQRQEWDANGAALWALAEHRRLSGDDSVVVADSVARAVSWIERKRHTKRRRRDEALVGLMPAGVSAEHLGPFDCFYWDDFWSLRGLIDGASLLRAQGQTDAADRADAWAVAYDQDIRRSLDLTAARLGTDAIPAGPRRRIDPGVIGSLVACYPLGLRPADDPAISATADVIRERFCLDAAFVQGISHTGLGTYLTMQLAEVELEAGDRRALDRLSWMLDVATPTFTWPEAIHPRLGGGCMGDGHHGWADAAEFLSLVRNLLVREKVVPHGASGAARDGGGDVIELALCSMLPPEWVGQPIEVHDAPTHAGVLSFAVRWHGDRPALLWELTPHAASRPARLTAPGLDPEWSSTDARGDALLRGVAGAGAPAR